MENTTTPEISTVEAVSDWLGYTPTGRTCYGYALGWATAQAMLLARLVEAGVLTQAESQSIQPRWPDRRHFIRPGRGRPPAPPSP